MKNTAILLVLLLLSFDAAAQATAPVQIVQAGGSAPGSAAVGATVPAAHTGGGSPTVAVVGLGIAGFAAAAFGYSSTASNH